MARAYAVFDNGGFLIDPYLIEKFKIILVKIYLLRTRKLLVLPVTTFLGFMGETKDKIDGFKDVAEVANPDNLKIC